MGKEKKLTQQEAPLHGIHHKRRKSLVVRTLCFIFAASFPVPDGGDDSKLLHVTV